MGTPEDTVQKEREAHFLAFFAGNDEVCIRKKNEEVNSTPGTKRGVQDEEDEVDDDEEGKGPTYKWSHTEHMKVNIYNEIFYLLNHSHNGKYKLFTVHRYLV